jgi:hypothetical protein
MCSGIVTRRKNRERGKKVKRREQRKWQEKKRKKKKRLRVVVVVGGNKVTVDGWSARGLVREEAALEQGREKMVRRWDSFGLQSVVGEIIINTGHFSRLLLRYCCGYFVRPQKRLLVPLCLIQ